MSEAIAVRNLVKTFGATRALDGLELVVGSGEVHGFLGPNGSGKTTTLRILLGLLRADSGSASVLGHDPWDDAATLHARLAYVPGDVSLWPSLTGGEVIDLLGRLRGGLDPARRADLIERFNLDPTKKSRSYSKGNRQKVALIAALASDVELFLLDEPTSGLDPLMEDTFRNCVRQLRRDGRTVLLSSHILAEAEALCDTVSIIRDGAVVESGTLAQLRHLTATNLVVELAGREDVGSLAASLARLSGVTDVAHEAGRVTARVEPGVIASVMGVLSLAQVVTLTSSPPTLEELFLRHYSNAPSGSRGVERGREGLR